MLGAARTVAPEGLDVVINKRGDSLAALWGQPRLLAHYTDFQVLNLC